VALKIIRPGLAQRREILERFRREFQAARQILHPNVVRLFELGTADGLKFMSMQYVEGQTLDALLLVIHSAGEARSHYAHQQNSPCH
jgi:serine/threonine-protein kinase